jgi:hypothetical protein
MIPFYTVWCRIRAMPTLWYDLKTPEGRRAAMDEIVNLRGDPHVERARVVNLMIALRDRQDSGSIEIDFIPDETRPADPRLPVTGEFRPPPVPAEFETLARITDEQMQRATQNGDEALQRMIDAQMERALEHAREGMSDLIRRSLVDTPRREFHPEFGIGINPIRRNIDYQGVARRTLVLDELPERGTYDHLPETSAKPPWPDWCRVGAVVYDQQRNPFKIISVEADKVECCSIEDNGERTQPLQMIIVCTNPKELWRWSRERPRSSWERLSED